MIIVMVMQELKDDGSSTLFFGDGTQKTYTEYDEWVINQIVRDYKDSDNHFICPRPHELAEIFPESKAYLKERKKEIAVLLGELLEDDRKIGSDLELVKIKNKELREHKLAINEIKKEKLLNERLDNETILSFINPKNCKKVQDFERELAKAKSFPIDKLIKFNKKVAECLWHTDSNPSLYYYEKDNRVHCFVCEKGGDSIDVVRQQRGCSIGEAIAFINGTTV